MDFALTRAQIDRLPAWVDRFAARCVAPERVNSPAGGFRWEHSIKDAETLQVAKAVRIASGLRAAIVLADSGHTVECGVLLRTVSDFCSEIVYVGEGLAEKRFTGDQERFIQQHFSALPQTPDELAAREREYYVGRKDIAKAFERIITKAGASVSEFAKIHSFLNKGYDSYVHGAYPTAMELYTGRTMTFMLRGNESERLVCVAKVAVAGKLREALNAFRFMAMTRSMQDLAAELRDAFTLIDNSGEDAGLPCRSL